LAVTVKCDIWRKKWPFLKNICKQLSIRMIRYNRKTPALDLESVWLWRALKLKEGEWILTSGDVDRALQEIFNPELASPA
jgi:hypothetical protein